MILSQDTALILDVRPPELGEIKLLWSQANKCVAVCYSSHKRLILPGKHASQLAPQGTGSTRASHRLCTVPVIKYEQAAKNPRRLESRV